MVIILVIITVFYIINGCLKTSIGRVVVVVTGVHTCALQISQLQARNLTRIRAEEGERGLKSTG
jgi:hypothetical protein